MLESWKRFIEGQPPEAGLSDVILESWQRCRSYELSVARAQLRRLPPPELQGRLSRHAALLHAARPHLRWALAALETLRPLVVILADPEGVILESVGNDAEAMSAYGLIPGYDWSERAMGSNGIGTALAYGAPVAVVGAEHYVATWHNNTCVGAPILGPGGERLGAVDICTSAEQGDPARLVLVSFLAHLIARELGRADDGEAAFAGVGVLQRAAAGTSTASEPALRRHARELCALGDGLREAVRADEVPRTPVDLGLLLRAGLRDRCAVHVEGGEPLFVWGCRQRLERAVEHLVTLCERQFGPGAGLLLEARAVGSAVQVGFRSPPALQGPTANAKLQELGRALGHWLVAELLGGQEGRLEVNPEPGLRYLVTLRRADTVSSAGA